MTKGNLKLTIAALAALASVHAGANLVSNGGFETGFSGSTTWIDGNYASPWYAGWHGATMTDDQFGDGVWTGTGFTDMEGMFQGVTPYEGSRFAVVGVGGGYDHNMNQVIGGMVSGGAYTVSLAMLTDDTGRVGYGAVFDKLGPIEVEIDGVSVGFLAANTVGYVWETRSLSFVWGGPTTSSSVFTLKTNGAMANGYYFTAVDAVEVVPEPGAMLAAGAALLGLRKRRRA